MPIAFSPSSPPPASGQKSVDQRGRIAALWIAGGGALAAALFVEPSWQPGGVIDLAVRFAGALAVASCILIRWWAALHVAGLKSQVLVTDGPYARVRHPLYLGSFLGMLGTGLMLGSLLLGAGFLVLGVAVFAPTIVREERFLRSRFGEAHERYASQVPAILPITTAGQRHGNEETHLSVRRRTFERMSGEALWFLLAYGTPPLFAALHAVSALPLVEAP